MTKFRLCKRVDACDNREVEANTPDKQFRGKSPLCSLASA